MTDANRRPSSHCAKAEARGCPPDSGYIHGSDDFFEQIGAVEAVPDRLIIYQGSLLHSGIIPPGMTFSADPREGPPDRQPVRPGSLRNDECIGQALAARDGGPGFRKRRGRPAADLHQPDRLDYRYNFEQINEGVSYRTGADPAVVNHKGAYYLFLTLADGYWRSTDLIHWTFVTPSALADRRHRRAGGWVRRRSRSSSSRRCRSPSPARSSSRPRPKPASSTSRPPDAPTCRARSTSRRSR